MNWAARVMVYLNYATSLVLLNLLWILGVLAGGIVTGILPASRSCSRLVTALFLGSPSDRVWHDFWSYYARSWKASNQRGWPFLAVAALAAADLYAFRIAQLNGLETAAFFLIPFLIVAAMTTVAFSFYLAVELRYTDAFAATWRFVLLAPLTFFPTSLSILLLLTAFTMLTWQLPLIIILAGFIVPVALPAVIAGSTIDRRLAPGFRSDDSLLINAEVERTIRLSRRV
ncbi:DUF624 domain-containing protein [Jonesia quinghaiensis]|uniref:DUF624 domain-containing protein n=1 Tax=Jonesia quinghaiensis TaxID=262806 RepID=UPI00041F34F2|nr:DUF624 domain-containing protein [Jonesia quinghaiensis]